MANSENLLKAGKPGNKGGGRPAEWLKEKCRTIVQKRKLVEFLADVAAGEPVESVVAIDGKNIMVPAKVKDRITATEMLVERGYGKVVQETEVVGLTELMDKVYERYK